MGRDSLIGGPRHSRPFNLDSHGIDEDEAAEFSSNLRASDSRQRLSSLLDPHASMLTLSNISISGQLSELNFSQVDPADLPPPLTIDKNNRLVTDTRAPQTTYTDRAVYTCSRASSEVTVTPPSRQRALLAIQKRDSYDEDDTSTVQLDSGAAALAQVIEDSQLNMSQRDSKTKRDSDNIKLAEKKYLAAVYGTESTKDVYKKDAEGQWERIGKEDIKLNESYDAEEKERKVSLRKAESDAKAEARAAAKAQRKREKEMEREARIAEFAVNGIKDDPWALMITGLPPNPKKSKSSPPNPPSRPAPEIPQRESSVTAVTVHARSPSPPVTKKRGRKKSDTKPAAFDIPKTVKTLSPRKEKNREKKKTDANNATTVEAGEPSIQQPPTSPPDATTGRERIRSGFMSASRDRSSSVGRFLSRTSPAKEFTTYNAEPQPSHRISHQRGRHQGLTLNDVNAEERTESRAVHQNSVGGYRPVEGERDSSALYSSVQGSTDCLEADNNASLKSKEKDQRKRGKKGASKRDKRGNDCLSSFNANDADDKMDEEPAICYSPQAEKQRKDNFVAFKNQELRVKLGCESKLYVTGLGPKHPNHERVWGSKNLWCASCPGYCEICGEYCCAYQKYMSRLEDTANSLPKKNAQDKIDAIQLWEGTPREGSTFIKCTDCGRMVCPECCGMCPVLICQDLQCIDCKVDPWAKCNWHA